MDEGKVKRYTRIKYTVAILDIVLLLVMLTLFQLSGLAVALQGWISRISSSQPIVIFLYIFTSYILYSFISFPLALYRSYIVEHQFGLSSEKFSSWLKDLVKAEALSIALFALLIETFYFFLRHYPAGWWWMSAIFWIFLSIVIARIFPVVIIPLFFKYKSVEDEALKKRVMELSGKMGVKVLDVYEIDFSKKSTKANAALVGLGRSKRVIFTDTLLGKYAPEEIEAVLAHEFAHHRLNHLAKLVVLSASATLATFYIFSRIGPSIFSRFDIAVYDIAGLAVWLFLFMAFQIILTPIQNFVSRRMEKNADLQALKYTGNKNAFISMLEKLGEQNLSERKPSVLAKILFYDHPPMEERIALAREAK
jgi:STE24 endopeptidase